MRRSHETLLLFLGSLFSCSYGTWNDKPMISPFSSQLVFLYRSRCTQNGCPPMGYYPPWRLRLMGCWRDLFVERRTFGIGCAGGGRLRFLH
jgi:hypothetical protein